MLFNPWSTLGRPAALRASLACVVVLSGIGPAAASAQQGDWDRREVSIPVRDGVKLHALVITPKPMTMPLPILLSRTPYPIGDSLQTGSPGGFGLARDGYIFVYENVRGRFKSEGKFVMNGALHDPITDPKGVDEATDAYDTIDWLVKNIPNNNGRVGIIGKSYGGWLAGIAGVNPHPALKAISSQAPMTDTWMGDDFFHQGAFRQSVGVEWATLMEWPRDTPSPLTFDRYDLYDWYLQFPTLKDLGEKNGIANLPSWTGFRTHPAWDAYWQGKAMQMVLTTPEVPMLNAGGFWDEQDVFGPQEAYRTLERNDPKNVNHIVLGPWFHANWDGSAIGGINPQTGIGGYFQDSIQRPWFAYYLHGRGDGKFAEAYAYESNGGQWRTFTAWPPKEAQLANFYLRENGVLSFAGPTTAGADSYMSDPQHPVPHMARPVDERRSATWLVEDQRFVDNRPDVLTYVSDTLTEDLVIAGDITAHLFASTTGTDADWVVKLIDVFPENEPSRPDGPRMGGYELMVAGDIMRGRYFKSWSKPQAIPANTTTEFTVSMNQQLYRFLRGHRIMVQVQSTWFPLYDRNPQTFVPNIFDAKASDFKAQTHTVHHGPGTASRIAVTVLPSTPSRRVTPPNPTYTEDVREAACSSGPQLGCDLGLDQFALIPAGTFEMGSDMGYSNERPVHTVTISRAFYLQKTEVTQTQWLAVMESLPRNSSACGDTCPVAWVSWDDIQTFLQRLNATTPGVTYRLPTEAEWEYAARAGTTGDTYGPLDSIAWFDPAFGATKHPVAGKQANAWGLYDMLGRQREWVSDWEGPYTSAPAADPAGPPTGSSRVLRGSGYWNDMPYPRAASRASAPPSRRGDQLGFRLVRNP